MSTPRGTTTGPRVGDSNPLFGHSASGKGCYVTHNYPTQTNRGSQSSSVPYRKGLGGVRDNFRRLYFESHGFSDLLRESTLGYAAALGLSRDLLLPLSVITWVSFANRKREDLVQRPDAPAGHLPLIMFEDGACLNLEILAQNRTRYLLA